MSSFVSYPPILIKGWRIGNFRTGNAGCFMPFCSSTANQEDQRTAGCPGFRPNCGACSVRESSRSRASRESLGDLGIDVDEQDEFLLETLLALRGWAGMIWQMETARGSSCSPRPAGNSHRVSGSAADSRSFCDTSRGAEVPRRGRSPVDAAAAGPRPVPRDGLRDSWPTNVSDVSIGAGHELVAAAAVSTLERRLAAAIG